jgi:signal peptidase II
MTPKQRVLLIVFACAYPLDQLSKAMVSAWVPANSYVDRVPVITDFFYISHARNPGAAFGMLIDWEPESRLLVFLFVAAFASIVMVAFYRGLAPGDRFNAFALGLVLSGALGNLTDRVLRGEVIDFLHFRLWGDFAWPDFNLADSFIVVGVATLMLELLASEGAARAEARSDSDAEVP